MTKIIIVWNKQVLVDDDDYEKLKEYKWVLNSCGYVYRYGKASDACYIDHEHRGRISMSRTIMELDKNDKREVDHINRNPLDNRKINLRIISRELNNMNRPPSSNNKSGFKGVCWSNAEHMWRAYITINKKQKHLGFFKDKNMAAKAYNTAVIKYFGYGFYLNII